MASVLANNVAAIAALANGLRQLRMMPDRGKRVLKLPPIPVPPAPRTKRDRIGDLIPSGPPRVRRVALMFGVAALGFVLHGLPGWPLALIGTAMLIPPRKRPRFLQQWPCNYLPVRIH